MTAQCAHAGFLMQGKDLKRIAVPGGITRALAVGRAIRAARSSGTDPVGAAAKALEGWVLFRGRVAKKEWESRDGYMYGTTTVEGEGPDAGHTLRVWFKNENHVTWRDGAPWVLSPDLVMTIGADGTPYTNTLLPEGARIGVIGAVGLYALDRSLRDYVMGQRAALVRAIDASKATIQIARDVVSMAQLGSQE